MLPLISADDPLFKKWDSVSLRLIPIAPRFAGTASALGRVDCYLRIEDSARRQNFKESDIPNGHALTDFLTLSQLWVFGAYEWVRSLDQYLQDDRCGLQLPTIERVRASKRSLERIRVPLAKFEPANRFRTSDQVPSGACVLRRHEEKGWCWKISDSEYIWRVDLADEILELLESLPKPSFMPKG